MTASGERLYDAAIPYPDVLERGRAQVIALPVWHEGRLVPPTVEGSSLTILRPDGTALVSGAAISVSGSVARYSLSAAQLAATEQLGEGWQQEWTLVLGGTTHRWRREMALARWALRPAVTEADLLAEYPKLNQQLAGFGSNLQGWIDLGWREIVRDLIGRGALTYLIVSSYALHDWHRNLALFYAFKAAYRSQPGEQWRNLMELHQTSAASASQRFNATIDADHDGVADDSSRKSYSTIVHVNPAPTRQPARTRW